nr:16079_t:CDS:2 [Entrophospora candida]
MDGIYVGKCCLGYWNEDNLTAKDKLADDFLQIPQIQIQVSVIAVINFNILQEGTGNKKVYVCTVSEHAFFPKFETSGKVNIVTLHNTTVFLCSVFDMAKFDGHGYVGGWILASLPNESNSNLPSTQRFASNGFLIKASV